MGNTICFGVIMIKKRVVNLPVEMVEEILLRLPVKSLVRFSSVSKAWHSMISDPGFVRRYRGRERVILEIRPSTASWISSVFTMVDHGPICPVRETEPLVCPFSETTRLKAWCAELLLAVGTYGLLSLWNPSTRMFKKIPPSNSECAGLMSLDVEAQISRYGLGYDSAGDDYKILKIQPASSYCAAAVELYSLRSNSWRNISYHINVDKPGLSVGGNIYWISSLGCDQASIIYFNLSSEKFGEVAPPLAKFGEVVPPLFGRLALWRLGVLRGMLCMSLHHYGRNKIDIWVMEGGAWSEQVSVEYSYPVTCYRPLYIYETGEILMKASFTTNSTTNLNLVYGDEDEETATQVYDDAIVEAFVHVESLAMWPTSQELPTR